MALVSRNTGSKKSGTVALNYRTGGSTGCGKSNLWKTGVSLQAFFALHVYFLLTQGCFFMQLLLISYASLESDGRLCDYSGAVKPPVR